MTAVLSFLAIAAAMVFVGWPLFRSGSRQGTSMAQSRSPLERQKLEAYAAIKEAEFDRRMGKLSDEDFADLTQRYRAQALAAIAALEKSRAQSGNEGKRPAAKVPSRFAFCPACGARLPARANFCGACGRPLHEAVA